MRESGDGVGVMGWGMGVERVVVAARGATVGGVVATVAEAGTEVAWAEGSVRSWKVRKGALVAMQEVVTVVVQVAVAAAAVAGTVAGVGSEEATIRVRCK